MAIWTVKLLRGSKKAALEFSEKSPASAMSRTNALLLLHGLDEYSTNYDDNVIVIDASAWYDR